MALRFEERRLGGGAYLNVVYCDLEPRRRASELRGRRPETQNDMKRPPRPSSRASVATVVSIAAGVVVVGCGLARANHDQATASHQATGDWLLRGDPPLAEPGLHVTITVDSVRAERFFGRLSHLFTGNVGTDPREYRPFVGSIDSAGAVQFTIERRDSTLLGMEVEGRIVGDTIRCTRLMLGPDELTGTGRSWFFVRARL